MGKTTLTQTKAAATTTKRRSTSKDIAIIGMACRFPGANDYTQFWNNLIHQVNSIREIPRTRWDWREHYGNPQTEANKTNIKWGGFIDDIDKFDFMFFNIEKQLK